MKKKKLVLPGQKTVKTLKEAFEDIKQTLGTLHVQTRDNLKRKHR